MSQKYKNKFNAFFYEVLVRDHNYNSKYVDTVDVTIIYFFLGRFLIVRKNFDLIFYIMEV